jgi:asparagine synthase (glutamine-hydrolysing)
MSVQFGRWNFDGKPVDPVYVHNVEALIAPHGPDGGGHYAKGSTRILYRAFCTTKASRHETQPYVSSSGEAFTWDGRLDNREELLRQFPLAHSDSTDVAIVAATYNRWGKNCFEKLIGDWALSIWNPADRVLLLAKDPIGTRHLYYSLGQHHVVWSTILDALVLFAGRSLAIDEGYLAGWLGFFPAPQLTPYRGIHSVPPSSYVSVDCGGITVTPYQSFDPGKSVRYRSDAEYEEHFRAVLEESLRRRLRADTPVLAELSGGMDSSAIVCVADAVVASGRAETQRLDTLSYFDDSEPNWNERPHFLSVEQKRGRPGCHIEVGSRNALLPRYSQGHFAVLPGFGADPTESEREFACCLRAQGNRVLLSGIGGDEVLGGVPTPVPELADLLARGRFRAFARQSVAWALAKRKPLVHLGADSLRVFFPIGIRGVERNRRPAAWLERDFVRRNRAALQGYQERFRIFGPLPSFQENLATLDGLRRQLACSPPSCEPLYEKCYPYLDRDLLAFLYAIPREQLVRPGQRRSLMRRALAGMIPDEILHRKRKAFVVRAPMIAVSRDWAELSHVIRNMLSASLGIVNSQAFSGALQKARDGREIHIVHMMRTLGVEFWLRHLRERNLLAGPLVADSHALRKKAVVL